MVFPDGDSFLECKKFVEKLSPADFIKWQSDLGFKSIRYHYELAKSEYCCPDETMDWAAFKAKYGSVVKVDEANFDYSPLIDAPTMNSFLNDKGYFRVGHALVFMDNSKIYSILDTDGKFWGLEKIDPAQIAPEYILDAHDFRYQIDNSNTVGVAERGCSTTLNGNGGPFAYLDASVTNGNKRIKSADHGVYDFSYISPNTPLGNTGVVIYEHTINAHHQRKTFFGWTVCERTNWNILANYNLTHNLPSSIVPTNPFVANINWQNTPLECKYQYTGQLIGVSLVGQPISVYYNRSVTGTIDFDVTALNSGINAADGCP